MSDKRPVTEAPVAPNPNHMEHRWKDPDHTETFCLDCGAIRKWHVSGQNHKYSLVCEVCGQKGSIRVSIEPEYVGSVTLEDIVGTEQCGLSGIHTHHFNGPHRLASPDKGEPR